MTNTLLSRPLRVSGHTDIYSAPYGADVLALVSMIRDRKGLGVYVAHDDRQALNALKLAEFIDPTLPRMDLPAWDCLPYDRVSPTANVSAKRCSTLATLTSIKADAPGLLVTTAAALVQMCPPRDVMHTASFMVEAGKDVDQDALHAYLDVNGYVRVPTVRDRGDYSVRGGIIDIFSPDWDEPVRLDLFGDTLETLRKFDIESQRSTKQLKTATFSPVSEILFTDDVLSRFRVKYIEQLGAPAGDQMYEAARSRIRRQGIEFWLPLFHDHLDPMTAYLPDNTVIGMSQLASDAVRERLEQADDYYKARVDAAGSAEVAKVLPPEQLYLQEDRLKSELERFDNMRFTSRDAVSEDVGERLDARFGRDFAPERATNANVFDAAIAHAKSLRDDGLSVIFAAWTKGSADRLANVFEDHGLEDVPQVFSLDAALDAKVSIAELPIDQGLEVDGLAIVSEQDMLGERMSRQRRPRRASNFISELSSLNPGDLIVHIEHGVGRYEGLKTVEVNDAPHDCLELTYSGGDKLFLPVENIELVSRYGSEGGEGALDKLGGAGWQTRKAKAKKRILEMADDLIRIAAERALKKAPTISRSDGVYEEFAARFPYEETDDQQRAIDDTLGDLVSGRPMDRLVCGDVGFGKTEVALRAAFQAAMSGLQVAVIAPTTILARQHFNTFSQRLSGYPIDVRQISRLVSSKEAAEARAAIKSGQCDIVIGTHALLAKTIEFKRLGFLIIDEEQRFGVKHKERLKELKSDIHVLTLSATPIPRTLQLALTGIRDLSIIATPPIDRLSVRTYVSEFDPITIREALLRERYRGGQAFFVAPRISDLPRLEEFLKETVPEVSYVSAHGQMSPTELEDIMNAFYEGEYDVLLSTTIVESGIDIPRANTLIIYRADMYGLAQLYQLRGRVGRSKLRAYAYLTTPKNQRITETAEKRLKILQSLDSLGAGFMLASHDLDMRGGGNILGEEQSGHVREVGVELYQSMLEDAVKSLQAGGEEIEDDWSPQINMGLAVMIPDAYVPDLNVRLSLYRRLADISEDSERDAFAAELVDRFGPLPEETKQLLEIAAIKVACKSIGVAKIDAGPKGAVFAFRDNAKIDPQGLIQLVQKRPNQLKLRPDFKLVFSGQWPSKEQRTKAVRRVLADLVDLLPEE